MASLEVQPLTFKPEIQTQINAKIEDHKTKVFQTTIPILMPALQGHQNILVGEGNDEDKLIKIKEFLGNFVKTHNANPARSTPRDALEQGTDIIAKNIFAHLAVKVGECFTSPAPGLELFRTFTGLMSLSTSPDDVTRFFELASIEHLPPLMAELRTEFAEEVLEQYPPVQR